MFDFNSNSFAKSYREGVKAIIPQDKDSNIFLREVDNQTKYSVEDAFDPCPIINYDWHCNTIAYCVIEGFIKALNTDMKERNAQKAFINFYDLFSLKVTTKVNERAEKEGNINISFIPGPTAVNLISAESLNEVPQEKTTFAKFFTIEIPGEDPDIVEAINQKYFDIDKYVRYAVSNNYAIAINQEHAYMTFAICYHFILNLFKKLVRDLGANPDQELISVNFNDLVEFHIVRNEDNEAVFRMRPGLNAKLLIKSDEVTEDDDIYSDDML